MGCKTKDTGEICTLNGLQCHAGTNVLCYEEEKPQATKSQDLLRSDDTPGSVCETEEIIMKNPKEILQFYGRCCISENIYNNREYKDDAEGKEDHQSDMGAIQRIRGQKAAIEWLFED